MSSSDESVERSGCSTIPPPRPAESLLIEHVAAWQCERLLCTSLGRGQFAIEFAKAHKQAEIVCNFLDLYQAQQASAVAAALPQIRITCLADFPPGPFDAAAIPVTMSGDAELTRDLLQAAYEALSPGCRLIASTDNPRDRWLHQEVLRLCGKATEFSRQIGKVYVGRKDQPLKKRKDFRCEFAFRDGPRLLSIESRPGVFSHRKIDTGARALIEAMEIRRGEKVFDIGCGSGVVAIAAAVREPDVTVYALDSNPRAVQCTQRGAAMNSLTNITAVLMADGQCDAPGSYDVALANPPYYSQERIAGIFLRGAELALKPGGRLYVVTKHREWYENFVPQRFLEVAIHPRRGYWIVAARK